jgi:hypothetical protein
VPFFSAKFNFTSASGVKAVGYFPGQVARRVGVLLAEGEKTGVSGPICAL